MKHAAATLGSGNLRNAVQLPEGEDVNEWIAVNSNDQLEIIHVLSCINDLTFIFSCRLFQSNQYAVWYNNRILY